MNLFKISGIVITITCALLSVVALRFARTKLQNRWAQFNFAVMLWGIGCWLVGRATNIEAASFAWKMAFSGALFTCVSFYHIFLVFTDYKKRIFLIYAYFQGFFFLGLTWYSDFVFSDWHFLFDSLYYSRANLIYYFLILNWTIVFIYGHYRFFVFSKKAIGLKKVQAQHLVFGSFVGHLGGVLSLLPSFGIPLYPFVNFTIALYSFVAAYTIFKYRLLDITIVVTRTTIFIAVYSLVLGIPSFMAFGWRNQLIALFGAHWYWIPFTTLLVLATVGPFLYLYIQKRAEDRLLQEQRRYQSTLRQASLGMGRVKDLKKLLHMIVHIVTRTVKLDHGSIYLFDPFEKKYVLRAVRNKEEDASNASIARDSELVKYLINTRSPIVYEEVHQRVQDYVDAKLAPVEKEMRTIDAALVVPSFVEDKLLAIIILGKKKSGKLYSEEDLVVFSILANQAALAIENAQFYEDVKRTQEQLFQAEKMATIGTMADGLSHQLNNRFHALGFIAADALDTIKLKSQNDMSVEIKDLLSDVGHSLSRIMENVKQGGEIVQGLLKYTRKGEIGFSAVDLNELIDSSLEMAQFKIKLELMTFIKDFPSDIPKIRGNFTQLQEVFFNLIDNAYDAMMQRKNELKEEGFQPEMRILVQLNDSRMRIIIQDNGMGVKDEDKDKLFTPFFTTKLSSKKGTGLGLYVIQKIIEENHEGIVLFASKYTQGTTITMELPVFTG